MVDGMSADDLVAVGALVAVLIAALVIDFWWRRRQP